MGNIITFPGSGPGAWLPTTDSLPEAFAMAALLLRERQEVTHQVRTGLVIMAGDDVYPREPRMVVAGREITASEAAASVAPYLEREPLPGSVRLIFALWNTDGGDPATTYLAAAEWLQDTSHLVVETQRETPHRLGT